MKKKILSSVLCLAMLASMVTPVFADTSAADTTTVDTNTATSTADLMADALVFDLEVPTSLPITVDNEGNVEVATDATITNNSGGMVKVTNVSIDTTDSGWEDEVDTDGSLSLGDNWVSLYANGGTLDIDYEVNVASQSSSLELSIATVEFTLDWDSVEEVQYYSVTYGVYTDELGNEIGIGTANQEYYIVVGGENCGESTTVGEYEYGDLVTLEFTQKLAGSPINCIVDGGYEVADDFV